MKIDNLKSKIEKLSVKQKRDLINFIKNSYSVFNEIASVDKCPHCGSSHIVKNGTRNEITRYLCRECSKSFTYRSTTVLKGIHKLNKWNSFVEDFVTLNISTINEIKTKLEISTQTAIDWRHKLLAVLVNKENSFVNETVEFDETYFRISRKGRKNLNIKDKSAYKEWRKSLVGDSKYNVKMFFTYGRENSHLDLCMNHMGRSSVKKLESYFLPNRFQNITLISDEHISYKAFCKKHNITHFTFNSKDHVNPTDATIHNQTINAYTREFKQFVNHHLKGVSTKYLGFYAKWFEFISNVKKTIQKISKVKFNLAETICNNILSDFNGLEFYRQSEFSFIQFLKANQRNDYGSCKHYYTT